MVEGERPRCLAVHGEGLYFRFGGKKSPTVLNGLDIKVDRGIIYGLLGPSGCGKTTLLRCIVGRHHPSSGSIKIYGRVPGERGFCVPGPGVGFMPQELALYPEITMEETLTYFGRLYLMDHADIKERIKFLSEFLDIPDKKKQIKNLSGGQQRRVSFAVALIHKPPLVILDEPTVGVDPLLRQSIWSHLQRLAMNDHITIIITTHYVEEARQAHLVGLMRDGRLLAETNPEDLINQHRLQTLEEVFLKLCVKDSEAHEAIDVHFGQDTPDTVSLTTGSREDVWVPRKRNRPNDANCNSSYDHYKAALLNNDTDIEAIFKEDQTCVNQTETACARMRALINKNFVRLKRNIGLIFFQLFIPTFQVIVFCLCVGGEPFDLPMSIVNEETDPSGKAKDLLQHISSHTIHQIPFSNLTDALESVRCGHSWGVLHIGPTFTDSLVDRYLLGIHVDNETVEASTITMYLDMTNQQITSTIFSKIMESFQGFAEAVLEQHGKNPLMAQPPIVVGDPIYGDRKPNFTEFMAPGMILGIVYIMAVGLSAMSIIIEKKEGLLDRSWIAGVRSWEVLFSILLTLFLTMLLQVALVLLCTFQAFSIPSRGPIMWVVVAVLLVGLEGMAYGLFISAIVNDENIAMMIAMGSFYPNLLLSGIIWPVEAMPHYLRELSYCLPLTLIADSMRSILSRGWTITDNGIWMGYIVTICWIVPIIMISTLFFKYKK
ncbi:LOW QUALITY PROTEIN: ABC transporter G family member 20-like [Uloborus diversus]|uniref:LOW QUALITY PROTEIN: ABC transporter G family member 20-like n=1 Tax=Uloborus diversus TaxID=327109 RepID=UPI00240A062C|nr:LOW QUALITY PROTEIN: ABC transporter G family member 20-like [Uloborus diversus]